MKKEDTAVTLSPTETLNSFSDGRLKILQNKDGYRFSIDAVLLSQFVKLRRGEKVIDLGTGCGVLPLMLSQKTKTCSFVGVEIQRSLADCAARNTILNHLENHLSILHKDFRQLNTLFSPGSFNVVISNPPYRKYRTGRINPSEEKSIARHEIKATLNDLVSIASYLLPHKGRCYLIFPASRTVDLLAALRDKDLEPKCVQFIHPRAGESAKFLLIESIKSSGVELDIMPPLFLR